MSDAPFPLSLGGNVASPEANNEDMDNDNHNHNYIDIEGDGHPEADPALIFNNDPHPIDYDYSSGYLLFKLRKYSDSFSLTMNGTIAPRMSRLQSQRPYSTFTKT